VREDRELFFNHQSTIHSQLTRERTKNLDKSILSKREGPSRSPNREKEESTNQILQALQPKQREIKSDAVVHARKSIVFPMQARKVFFVFVLILILSSSSIKVELWEHHQEIKVQL